MIVALAALIIVLTVLFLILVRPEASEASPEAHGPANELEARREEIYEGLRDLQFEFRLGKLSAEDYQKARKDLLAELAEVNQRLVQLQRPAMASLASGERQKAQLNFGSSGDGSLHNKGPTASAPHATATSLVCPHCGARFAQPLKFCGECGKPMMGVKA